MDNLIWVIYLIDVVTQPMVGLGFLCVLCLVIGLVLVGAKASCDHNEDTQSRSDKDFINFYNRLPVVSVTAISFSLLVFSNFIPTQATAYKMLAVYGVSEVSKSENVQDLMGDGMEVLKLTLKDYKEKLERDSKGDD